MITSTQLYWITRLDGLQGMSILFAILVGTVSVIAGALYMGDNDQLPPLKKILLCLAATTLFALTAVLTPTTKQMCAILVIPKIINNVEVQKMPDKVLGLANEWLDELRPKKEETK